MPVGGEWLSTAPEGGEAMPWASEGVKGCFHIFERPEVWRPWMVLSKPAGGSCIGRPAGSQCWLIVRAVPMGWLSAGGVVQHLNRWLIGHGTPGAAGVCAATDLRKGGASSPAVCTSSLAAGGRCSLTTLAWPR